MIEQNKTYLKNRGFIFFVLFFLFTNLYSDSTNYNEYEELKKSINIKYKNQIPKEWKENATGVKTKLKTK
ncbi:polysaccharide deacetylase, partial [Aliarcobacter butzleri]|nr:polysaccharide deacetylase [Aliarcobacter butzleri]